MTLEQQITEQRRGLRNLVRYAFAAWMLIIIAAFATFCVVMTLEQRELDAQMACEAQSGQIQPTGECVKVLKDVSNGVYHIRPMDS